MWLRSIAAESTPFVSSVRAPHAKLRISYHDETSSPRFNLRVREHLPQLLKEGGQVGSFQTHQNEAGVRSKGEHARITETNVLSDQQPRLYLRRSPNLTIRASRKTFGVNVFYIVAKGSKVSDQIGRHVFVELDPHSDGGNAWNRWNARYRQ